MRETMITERMKEFAGISEARKPKLKDIIKEDPKVWAKQFLSDYKAGGGNMKFMPIVMAFEAITGRNAGTWSKDEENWIVTALDEIRSLAKV